MTKISIHALLAESDTLPGFLVGSINDFYPRSPCGERPQDKFFVSPAKKISIHALLAESDSWPRRMILFCSYFYPRSPCGERQLWVCLAGSAF